MIGHVARRLSSGAMNGNTVSTRLFSNGARDLSLTMVAEEVEVAPVPIATGTPI